MAINIMGEDREPQPMTFKWLGAHLTLFRAGQFTGMVSKNGWTGKSALIDYELGAPVFYNMRGMFSLDELQIIVDAWYKKFPAAVEITVSHEMIEQVDLVAELAVALEESLKLQAHYARSLNDFDGGSRRVFHDMHEWLDRLHETGTLPKAYSVEEIRKNHPNAYAAWDQEQDDILMNMVKAGESVQEMATTMGRQPGAIRSRIDRLQTKGSTNETPVDEARGTEKAGS